MYRISFVYFYLYASLGFSQSTITDNSGNIYKTVKIGSQVWMAENLRTEKFRNGDDIELIKNNNQWTDITSFAMNDTTLNETYPAMCYYNNIKSKESSLYNWYTVIDPREVCPTGWHIPSVKDFEELIEYLGGIESASTKLKSNSVQIFLGNNSSGFNALPVGVRLGSGEFAYKNEETIFWTEYYAKKQYEDLTEFLGIGLLLNAKNQNSKMGDFTIGMAASVRCIKN
jgi:uncharacterized protein (TIGR02145 family)